jgi:hypothetical protein
MEADCSDPALCLPVAHLDPQSEGHSEHLAASFGHYRIAIGVGVVDAQGEGLANVLLSGRNSATRLARAAILRPFVIDSANQGNPETTCKI